MARGGFEPSRCNFLGSAPRPEGAPASGLPEIAVAGRSNVGKSSLINFLLGRKGLARTSSTPGRTQLLNFFEVDGRLTVVDLPGYGYARAPREAVHRWMEGVESFVRKRDALKGVVVLLDVRRVPSPEDRSFIALVRGSGRSLLAIVTKADKVSRAQCARAVAAIRQDLALAPEDLVVTSAKDGLGRAEAWKGIFRMVDESDDGAPEAQPVPAVRVIAIDGPSGAGKSTVARRLADRLGWNHIDTGAMYRSIGLKADRTGVALDDDPALERLCGQTRLELHRGVGGAARILLDGEDVSEAIREHRVSDLASRVSARLPVRAAMAHFQRELGLASPSVLEGRDIGTVVFPDAFLKVYLTASAEERSGRRADELKARGAPVNREALLRDILERDANDSSREHAPLKAADDAVVVDTTGMTIDQVVERLAGLAGERLTAP